MILSMTSRRKIMGREIRMVTADFEWPLNKTWEGFLNPYYEFNKKCPFCDGGGYNPETKKIYEEWYHGTEDDWVMITDSRRYNNSAWSHHITQDEVQALVDHDRLMDFTHKYTQEKGWEKLDPLGVWGFCVYCKGEGSIWSSKDHEEAAEKWEPTDPPAGDYYQLWETPSEGSPISPPCETPEKLARWLTDNKASSFGPQTESYETWLEFVRGPGWAPSAIGTAGKGIESGVKSMVDKK